MAGFAHAEIRDKGIDLKLGVALESVQYVPNEHVASFESGESEKHQHLEGELELTLNNGEKLTTDILIYGYWCSPRNQISARSRLRNRCPWWYLHQWNTCKPAILRFTRWVMRLKKKDFVTGEPTLVPLAGPANRQGRMAADNHARSERSLSRYTRYGDL